MSGYVDLFFENVLTYINLLFTSQFMQYFLALFVTIAVLGCLRKLIKINR